ncbi:MAG: copper chaperone PCu(A)C [Actinomycetota bacterium]|nr:copper chaperone PCu(A)C [Actinomycetota bacterium]
MRRLMLLLVALGLLAAGCGGDSGVSVEEPWARSSPGMANAGAVYMDLSSPDGDRLMGAAVDVSIAGATEIHETAMTDGAMMMREVGEIDLPAGSTIALEPGSYHIMLLDIASSLEVGQTFDITLTFQNAGEKVVEVKVREEAP